MESSQEPSIFDKTTREDAALEQLGYHQGTSTIPPTPKPHQLTAHPELKRTFGLISMLGFSFSIVSSWSALAGVLSIGAMSGGPPVMIYSWLCICVFSMLVACCMAEMCSAYPVAGGQYSWSGILAPKKYARGFSYVCGWFMLIGIIATGAVVNFISAQYILAIAVLNNPSYEITRWETTLLAWGIALLSLSLNTVLPQFLHRISRFLLVWNVSSFFIVVVTILATNDHKQSSSFVFKDFQNFTGFGTAYTAILGLLQSVFGMCCYDAPSHMTEEIHQARTQAPRAIVMSVGLGCITGFVFLIAACFCIGDIASVASTPTGVPVIQIFFDSTGSVAGSSCLAVLISVINVGAANGLTAEGGRAVYAFARDRGLPFSSVLSKIHPKKQVPMYAICVVVVVQIALNAIYLGTVTGFNTVVSISTEGFYVSYLMPLLVRLISRLSGKKTILDGPWTLGRWSLPINIIGVVYLLFMSVTFNFPSMAPVDPENMNYASAAVGVIMLISLVTWVTTGRRQYTCLGVESSVIEGTPPNEPELEIEDVGGSTDKPGVKNSQMI